MKYTTKSDSKGKKKPVAKLATETKPTRKSTKRPAKAIIDALSSGSIASELPDGFRDTPPEILGRELLQQKEDRGYGEKILLGGIGEVDVSLTILKKLEQLESHFSVDEFNAILELFDITLDVGVWGGESWALRILLNGAVVFRNHHRVIGLVEQTLGSIEISNTQLASEISKLARAMDGRRDFSIIHRNEQGFAWTSTVPTKLSDCGQTLVFLPEEWIQKAQELKCTFAEPIVLEAAKVSTRDAVLRVFRNRTFIYATQRLNDSLDTIVENYSHRLGEAPDESAVYEPFKISTDREVLTPEFKRCLLYDPCQIPLSDLNVRMRRFVRESLNSYIGRKIYDTMSIEPVFGASWDIAPGYYSDSISSTAFRASGENIVSFICPLSRFESFKDIKDSFASTINSAVAQVPKKSVRIILYAKLGNRGTEQLELFDLGSPNLTQRIHLVLKELQHKYREYAADSGLSKEENEKQFLSDENVEFVIVIEALKDPDPASWHRVALGISGDLCASIFMMIPAYGFLQAYDNGSVDTGNSGLFLSESSEIEVEDEDTEDVDDTE
jgi:hypothetical protein